LDLYQWLDADSCDGSDDPLGDYALMNYDKLTGAQIEVWIDELERHWPAIGAVAAVALAGDPVNTELVKAIIDQFRTG
jgi:hypothetical protein